MNSFLNVKNGLVLSLGLLFLSCQQTEQPQSQVNSDSKPKLTADQVFNLVEEGTIPEPLGNCLQQWGPENTPFDEGAVRQYLSLNFNGDDVSYKDIFMTDEPKLTFLEITADEVDDINLRLMNPNGWYCLNVAVTTMDDLTIKVHCEAKILQSILESSDADDVRFKQICDGRSVKDLEKKEEEVQDPDAQDPNVQDPNNPDGQNPADPDNQAGAGQQDPDANQ